MRIAFDMTAKDPDDALTPCLLVSQLALGTRPSCEAISGVLRGHPEGNALHDPPSACADQRASR